MNAGFVRQPYSRVIGGKSLGGRIASLVADKAKVVGLVRLGYPFHPVGTLERLRIEHLGSIKTPTLILPGNAIPPAIETKLRGTRCRRRSRLCGSRTAITAARR